MAAVRGAPYNSNLFRIQINYTNFEFVVGERCSEPIFQSDDTIFGS